MIPRYLSSVLTGSLADFPVVLLVGARQVGKSTLAQAMVRPRWRARYATLDDRTTLDAALLNPDGFLAEMDGPVILDEVQRAPDLLRSVKLLVDRDRRPGRFLLTGSANVLTLASVSETLAGRVAVHELHPFSWTERYEDPSPKTLDALFEASSSGDLLRRLGASRTARSSNRIEEIKRFILTGGYPTPSLMRSDRSRETWFDSYRQTYVERDVRDVASIFHQPDFNRLLVTVASRTGRMLNASELSRDIGLPVTTIRRYFALLGQTFQVFLLHPYAANLAKRLMKTPKVYLADTGLACHLCAVDRWETLVRQDRVGAMVETWAVSEIRKLARLASPGIDLWYWRTRTGEEVDLLLERGGEIVGIEIKWSAALDRRRDLSGLFACREALKKRWRFGIVLHGGTEAVPIDDRTVAIPFAAFFGRKT